MSAPTLLPCPFCGAEVKYSEGLCAGDGNHIIHVPGTGEYDCGLDGFSDLQLGDGAAIEAWNRRAPSAAASDLYDALATLLAAVDKMDLSPRNGGGILPVDKALATGRARAALAKAAGK